MPRVCVLALAALLACARAYEDPEGNPAEIADDENPATVVSGELGKPLQVHCLESQDPTLIVAWYRGVGKATFLRTDSIYEISRNALVIRSLAIETLGQYTCQAFNSEGGAVEAPRKVEVRAYSDTTDEETGIKSKCVRPSVSVYQPRDTETTTISTSATIDPIGLLVTDTPKVAAFESGTAILRCLFNSTRLSSDPAPKITWKLGEHKIDDSAGRYRLTSDGALEIVSLYRNDTGVYICVADNGFGNVTQEIHLVVNEDTCSLPPEQGNCFLYVQQWYYDPSRDQCNQFVYTGCSGNDNRFESQRDCEARCKRPPPTTTTVTPRQQPGEIECQTPSSLAPCDNNVTVFYYDSEARQCLVSGFGGCGHPNTYSTEEECERRCGGFRGTDVCGARLDPGTCRASIPKIYWDALSGSCQPYAYGGCAGGPNRFSSVEECMNVCGDTGPAPACLQAVHVGQHCGAVSGARWHYRVTHGDCVVFAYLGCGGNDNNFRTYEHCADVCRVSRTSHEPVRMPVEIAGDENAMVTGELGQPLHVRCLAYGYPPPTVFWYRGYEGTMVPFNDSIYLAIGNVLQIRSLAIETLGQYTCQAYNGEGKAASWVVFVRAYIPDGFSIENEYLVPRNTLAPRPKTQPPTTAETTTTTTSTTTEVTRPIFTVPVSSHVSTPFSTLNIGFDLRLMCEVDGFPEPDVHWTKDGANIQTDGRITITGSPVVSRLTVKQVSVADSGLYACHASNPYSSQSDTAQINVQQLEVPANCTDNPFFANCDMIVRSNFCSHKYYSKFCCKSCVEAGQLDPKRPNLHWNSA